MKIPQLLLFLVLSVLPMAHGQDARFFRVNGPVATSLVEFTADGYLTWTNTPTNATFTVQMATSLGGGSNWVDYIQIPTTNGVNITRLYDPNPAAGMVLIPAGSFTMGDTLGDGPAGWEVPTHLVYVSAFYMDKTEVTKALWDDVYAWGTNHGYSFEQGASGNGISHPAESVTWYDAVKWCNARSEREGLVPAYYSNDTFTVVYRSGQVFTFVNWNSGYRLPTEAEWEKAARGGASGHRFPWSNVDTITHSQANYNSSTNYAYDISPTRGSNPMFNGTSPVGSFAPNGYGLYDTAGNVWEWCWDWWGGYSSGLQTDPCGPVNGSARVLRGGSWGSDARECRAAMRNFSPPHKYYLGVGFRSVLPLAQ